MNLATIGPSLIFGCQLNGWIRTDTNGIASTKMVNGSIVCANRVETYPQNYGISQLSGMHAG